MPATLDKLADHIERRMPKQDTDFVKAFSNQLFEKASQAILQEFDSESLMAITLGALNMMEKRAADEIAVRAFNPVYDVDGWDCPWTAVELSLTDRPFIVDSVSQELKRQGLDLVHLLHPIYFVQRDEQGRFKKSLGDEAGATREVYELYLVEQVPDEKLEELEQRIKEVLQDVVLATNDYRAMRGKVEEICGMLEHHQSSHPDSPQISPMEECEAFLHWLLEHNFVFLGFRQYRIFEDQGEPKLQVDSESALGILKNLSTSNYIDPVSLSEIPENLRQRVTEGPMLIVTKANAEATVHRPVRMDYIGLKRFDKDLNIVGEMRFLGLFTSNALSTPVKDIPILRLRLRQVLELDQAIEGSHDFKQIVTIFNSMPREELFWSDATELHRDIRTIMAMQQEHEVRMTVRPDPLARGALVMVIMPRERFNSAVRHEVQNLLTDEFNASQVDYQLSMGEDEEQVRFHFFLTTDYDLQSLDLNDLERRVVDLTRTWSDRLHEKLVAVHGESLGHRLTEDFAQAFPDGYTANTSLGMAGKDVSNILELLESGDEYRVDLVNPMAERYGEPATHVRIYHRQENLVLSQILPVLENLGLRVLLQSAYVIEADGNRTENATVDVFRVQNRRTGDKLDLRADKERIVDAITCLVSGKAENDRLNGLIVSGGLRWQEVALLKTYQMYHSQVAVTTSRHFINDILLAHPKSSSCLYRYFEARFKPRLEDREQLMERIRTEFLESLNEVSSLSHDRTLRNLFNLMESTVRTNFFQDKGYISHKISSRQVKEMPEPRPLYEIVVSGPGVEGIHLRGGMVARGGLRWSDRPDDFRTEVLGLMKTQMTKNAVIVPVGSKGGFVLKRAPRDRESLQKYVVEQYKTFIRGLLDLTDNNKGGQIVQPEDLVIYDGKDPYLVVAADKGTATFSDIANGVSEEYGFWLGDAFASGGSAGYDHKKEGITARGAWESVKRHFFEIGVDVMNEPFTVAGIGDMGGDVFGNGMLYTDQIKLQAAFNHIHIFLDPDPDPARSFVERKRMFELPRSTWEDYDKAVISEGGGVYSRAAKSIPLSPQVRTMLGVEEEALSGQDLIRAILKMQVDLLWNGGIGTYVRSSQETDLDVGDSNNDAVRITSPELQAKVIGEGGNQGFTQLGRIEYALNGGRINTDAIDNSAGVDMSDHEVNLKILMQPLVAHGELALQQRNQLLEEMTDDVSALVLKDNYWQTLCLSIAELRSKEDMPLFISLMDYLSDNGGLDLKVEFMPDRKVLAERQRQGLGFTRPELAIMLAYTKMGLYRRILETDFPDEPLFGHYLYDYFPMGVRPKYHEQIKRHPLRREIIATQFTNVVVDLLGITFVHRTIRDTGATPIQVIRAALAALEIVDVKEFLGRLTAVGNKVTAQSHYFVLGGLVKALENVVNWILLTDADLTSMSGFIETYREQLKELRRRVGELLPVSQRARLANLKKRFTDRGFTEEFASQAASLDYVPSGIGVVDNSRIADITLEEAAKRFYAVGERLKMGWLRDRLRALITDDKWETIALVGLIMDLRQIQLRLSLSEGSFENLPGNPAERYDTLLQEIVADDQLNLASGDVLARMLSQLAEGPKLGYR